MSQTPMKIVPPYYPIVYVRGYAMRESEREQTFHDAYYGFSATSVEKRQAPPPKYFEADVFEGQLIRLMKIKDYGYADAVNRGLELFQSNPSRSIWVCRFYDQDFMSEKLRRIEDHAEDLYQLVCNQIPARLKACGMDLGTNDQDYKVILIAHSMGGLVCRTLIQNLLPYKYNQDPKRWVHRLVTMGTPHGGIDLSRIPDFLQDAVTSTLNPFDANIFREERMREYLKLQVKNNGDFEYDVHSLGPQDIPFSFPARRCLCLIGSDYQSYTMVKQLTGNFSDGLVKQDRAYLVEGEAVPKDQDYPLERRAYWANVHRAHSGYRGIVNSFESYENIQRFLFGNTKAALGLEKIKISTAPEPGNSYFYDVEFQLSVRGSNVYLHQRQQDPCENAIRLKPEEMTNSIFLHNVFMNSGLRQANDPYSHFNIRLRVIEHRVKDGFLWDHEYPDRPIYAESLEVRVGDSSQPGGVPPVDFRWLSDGDSWSSAQSDGNRGYSIPFRAAGTLGGNLWVKGELWESKA